MRKVSEEALLRMRRVKAARRAFQNAPLFAYTGLQMKFPGYTYETFIQDITPRRKKKRGRKKSPLTRYGRFQEIQKEVHLFTTTGDPIHGLRADLLRRYLYKPFRILVRRWGRPVVYTYPATYSIAVIKQLTTLSNNCGSSEEYEQQAKEVLRYVVAG